MPKKSLGQNFLRDRKYVKQFVNTLKLDNNDQILEIGPGEGAVTGLVFSTILGNNINNISYTAVEIDESLAQKLEQNYRTKIDFTVINQNFLDFDLSKYIGIKIFGSIPYYISSPILHKIIFESDFILCSMIVQKEFAEKLIFKESKVNYWSMLLIDFDVSIVSLIPNKAFYPIPKVDSAIIKIIPNDKHSITNMRAWSKFLHHLFLHQRKMIKKNFDNNLLAEANIDGNLRPSQLTTTQIINLFKLHNKNNETL